MNLSSEGYIMPLPFQPSNAKWKGRQQKQQLATVDKFLEDTVNMTDGNPKFQKKNCYLVIDNAFAVTSLLTSQN